MNACLKQFLFHKEEEKNFQKSIRSLSKIISIPTLKRRKIQFIKSYQNSRNKLFNLIWQRWKQITVKLTIIFYLNVKETQDSITKWAMKKEIDSSQKIKYFRYLIQFKQDSKILTLDWLNLIYMDMLRCVTMC